MICYNTKEPIIKHIKLFLSIYRRMKLLIIIQTFFWLLLLFQINARVTLEEGISVVELSLSV